MFGDIMEPTHLLFILVVALLVLGPKRLPEVGRTLGSGIRDFRQAISGELPDHPEPDPVESATEQRHQPSATATANATENEPDATPWYEETVEPIDEPEPTADEPDPVAHTQAAEPAPQQSATPPAEPVPPQSVTPPTPPQPVTPPAAPDAEPEQPAAPAPEPQHAAAPADSSVPAPEHTAAEPASETRTEPGA